MMQEQQSRKGSKAEEEGEFEPEDDEEVQEAKGNSVFDAPVVNLAAGLQLGFTPSTAGKPSALAPSPPHPMGLWQRTPRTAPLALLDSRLCLIRCSTSYVIDRNLCSVTCLC